MPTIQVKTFHGDTKWVEKAPFRGKPQFCTKQQYALDIPDLFHCKQVRDDLLEFVESAIIFKR